jgi:hypothetical protein
MKCENNYGNGERIIAGKVTLAKGSVVDPDSMIQHFK